MAATAAELETLTREVKREQFIVLDALVRVLHQIVDFVPELREPACFNGFLSDNLDVTRGGTTSSDGLCSELWPDDPGDDAEYRDALARAEALHRRILDAIADNADKLRREV